MIVPLIQSGRFLIIDLFSSRITSPQSAMHTTIGQYYEDSNHDPGFPDQ
jgi:hypothetical protein